MSTPAGGPFVSAPFSWTAGTNSSPTEAVTGSDARGNSAVTTLSYVDDETAPSGGTISYPDGYQPTGSVMVSFTAGADTGSGVNTAVGRLSRSVAPLTNGVCGTSTTNSSFAINPSWPFVDSTVQAGSCYAYAFTTTDNVGNSATATSGNMAKISAGASYDFEEGTGTTAADGTGNGNTATLQSGAGWTTGVVNAKALNVTGASNSWASSAGPVVDTSKSFTVAGWVRLNSTGGYQTIASIDGSTVSPFYLQKAADGLFTFGTHSTDSTSATLQTAKGVTPTTGTWYHLAGSYDAAAGSISLYVNGSLQQTTTGVSMFQATGATTLGRATYNGNVDFVDGAIDDVRFYDRTLSAGQISTLYGLGDPNGPTGGSVDATGLTGTGSRYATSTTLSLALAKGTDASGLAASGNVLQRATATLSGGTCGSYGSPVTVATDPGSTFSETVADGFCYRYSYVVSDVHGNATTYASGDVKVDTTAPAAPSLAFSALSNAYASGGTLYYRSAVSGSFTVTASGSDAQSGVASYAFPSLGAGWTATPGATGVTTYSWTASPAAPGTTSVTATNNASSTSPGAALTPIADDTGPTGATLSYPDGATSASTVAVTFGSGTDAGSGIASTVLQRSTATYNGTTCAGFGGFVTIATNPTSPYTDTPTAGACFQYRLLVTDNLGNTSTVTSTAVARVTMGASYDFEEGSGTTSADGTGNNNTLTLQSGAGWTTGVDAGKALSVNGSGSSWASSAGPTLDTSQSFTVAGWVKFNSVASFETIAGTDGSSVSPFFLQERSGAFVFETYGTDATNGSTATAQGGSATNGVWYHVAGVYDGAAHTATLYVDGSSVATATGASTFSAKGSTTIGRAKYAGGAVDFVNGAIDDVRFVNRALTQTEIKALVAAKDSAGPTGGSVDATGLAGTGSRYSTSTTLSLALATGTDASGIATSGNLLKRATATLTGGTCGTYGAPATVASDPGATVSDMVSDGACYRYSYVVSDAQGNPTTYTSPDVKVDTTAPAAPTLAFSGLTNAYARSGLLYYRPAASNGTFTVAASSADAVSGVSGYTLPSLGTGWTSTPGGSGVATYSWSPTPTEPSGANVTATNGAGLTASSALSVTEDSTAPSGGTVSYADGVTISTSVSLSTGAAGDAGSGIGNDVLQRASATYDGTTCGTFGAYATVVTSPSSALTDTVNAGSCYQYQRVVTDNVGNVAISASSSVVEVYASQKTVYSARETSSLGSGTVPTTDTLVPGMSVTVPAAPQSRTMFVDYTMMFSGSHTNRFAVWVDGTQVHPTGTTLGLPARTVANDNLYYASLAGVAVTLSAGQSHTVEVRYQAADSTSAITFVDRSMSVSVLPLDARSSAGPEEQSYWMRSSTSTSSGTVPATDTLVPGMSVDVPAASADRTVYVDYTTLYTGGHSSRFSLYLDGQRVHPAAGTDYVASSTAGGGNPYVASVAGVPVTLTGGSSHTLEVRWQAGDASASVTLVDRALSVRAPPVGAGTGPELHLSTRSSQALGSGTVPTSDTLVPEMSLAVPTAAQDRTVLVSYTALFTGSHTNRFSIYVDGQRVHPIGSVHGVVADVHAADAFNASVAGVPVLLSGGSGHIVEVRWQASQSQAAVTLTDRTLTLDVLPGT